MGPSAMLRSISMLCSTCMLHSIGCCIVLLCCVVLDSTDRRRTVIVVVVIGGGVTAWLQLVQCAQHSLSAAIRYYITLYQHSRGVIRARVIQHGDDCHPLWLRRHSKPHDGCIHLLDVAVGPTEFLL
jgi:hypothetical protein